MVDSKGKPSGVTGKIDDINRGNLADRDSVRRTEKGDKGAAHGQNTPDKPAGKKPAKKKK